MPGRRFGRMRKIPKQLGIFPYRLPGATTAAIYMAEGMSIDGSDNLDTWTNYADASTYPLTSAEGTEPVAQNYDQFGGALGMSCSGTQKMTSSTLKAFFTGNAAFTMYIACQFVRDETSGNPLDGRVVYTTTTGKGSFYVWFYRRGTGPDDYNYTLYVNKKLDDTSTDQMAIAGLSGTELSSDKMYICVTNTAADGAAVYVNSLATTDTSSHEVWNASASTLEDDVTIGNSGSRGFKGPIPFFAIYPAEHTEAQIESMISPTGYLATTYNEQGDTIEGLEPVYYCPVNDATINGEGVETLPNQV